MEWVDRGNEYIQQIEKSLDFWMPYIEELGIPLKRPQSGAYYPSYHSNIFPALMRFYDAGDAGIIQAAGDCNIAPWTIHEQTLHELGHTIMYQHGDRDLKKEVPQRYPYIAEGASEALWFEGMRAMVKRGELSYLPLLAKRTATYNLFGRSPLAGWHKKGYVSVQRLRSGGARLQDILMHPEWFIDEMDI
jgi:hypothetical protein